MPIFIHLRARLATVVSYLLDPFGTAQARNASPAPEPEAAAADDERDAAGR
jgi:hypothetical protein